MNADSQIVVDGLLTHYAKMGAGKTLLFLHGWGDSGDTFGVVAADLSAQYEVWLLDLPGFGKTQSPASTWNIPDYAQFVSAFTKKAGCQPDVIIGHSNGGTIAIDLVANNLLKPKKLVLLASAGVRSEYNGRKKALRLLAKGAKVVTKPLPKNVQTKLKKKAYKSIGSDLFVAEHLQETFKNVVTYDVTEEAAGVSIPTLLIYGSKDEATPPRYGDIFHRQIKGSKLLKLPGVGHFVHQEAAEQVASAVREFIDG